MGVMLEPFRGPKSRHRCPQCGRLGKFTRYIDENGVYIADDVGRCDREDQCSYHKRPRDHFKNGPQVRERRQFKPRHHEPERPVDFLPHELMRQTLRGYEQNNLFIFLRDLIGEDNAMNQMTRYNIGTSKHWLGASVFWQVDINGRVRQLKLMLYNSETGKRLKSKDLAMKWDYITETYREDVEGQDKSLIYGKYILGGRFKECNLQQCFFGEHLLQKPGRIALVESEKTAVISSHYYPDLTWIATGGSNGAGFTKSHVCRVLQGREIILFPDLGQFKKWTEKAQEMQRVISCKAIVSDLLEAHAGEIERAKGYDLADYLIANNGLKTIDNKIEKNSEVQWSPLEGFEGF